jgi:hypothetical protein
MDTTQEQWGTYFPSLFGGSPFTIFYKDSNEEEVIQVINQLMIDLAQLSDSLPFFPHVPTPFENRYVGEFCDYFPKDRSLRCNPGFDPYGSFILEDRVFWIGRSWDEASDQALMDFLENR